MDVALRGVGVITPTSRRLRSAFFINKIDRIHYSMFDVGRSMFDVHQFLSRLGRPFFCSAAELAPETQFSKKNGVNFHHLTIDPFLTGDPLPGTSNQHPATSDRFGIIDFIIKACYCKPHGIREHC